MARPSEVLASHVRVFYDFPARVDPVKLRSSLASTVVEGSFPNRAGLIHLSPTKDIAGIKGGDLVATYVSPDEDELISFRTRTWLAHEIHKVRSRDYRPRIRTLAAFGSSSAPYTRHAVIWYWAPRKVAREQIRHAALEKEQRVSDGLARGQVVDLMLLLPGDAILGLQLWSSEQDCRAAMRTVIEPIWEKFNVRRPEMVSAKFPERRACVIRSNGFRYVIA